MAQNIVDNRKYEQDEANKAAKIYEKAISQWDYRYNNLTAYSWGKRFNEPFLDFGCGVGMTSQALRRLSRQTVAIDISKEMLRFAKERSDVPLVLADALNMPFRDKVFSTTCVIGVLHHILDLEKAIAEISRCTKEVICINEPCPKPPLAVKLLHLMIYGAAIIGGKFMRLKKHSSKEKLGYKSKYERDLDPKILVQLCEKNGFKYVQLRYFNHLPQLQKFFSEKIRSRLFAKFISSKSGTDAEIIAFSSQFKGKTLKKS